MRKGTKLSLIVATALIVTGLAAFAAAASSCGWDLTKLSTEKYVANTYEVNGDFDKISIDADTSDVTILRSDDNRCRIVCSETSKVTHPSSVENGTLTVTTVDKRRWYDHIGIFIGNDKLTVYLPKSEYESLEIKTGTGDVQIPADFAVENIKIEDSTGDVSCLAAASGSIEIEAVTGTVSVVGAAPSTLYISSKTGDIKLDSVTVSAYLNIETVTGDAALKNSVSGGGLSVKTTTGDVRLEGCDGGEICIETTTGDVIGTLLHEKIFITETSTGEVSVPKTTSGGKCEIKTDTGDIKIEYVKTGDAKTELQ